MSTKREAALDAARRGFNVFPIRPYVHPGDNATPEDLLKAAKNAKAPLIANWQNQATQDPQQIEAWWDEWPDANIAAATNDLIVIDVDPRNGGHHTMAMLAMIESFDKSLRSRTAGDGEHGIYAAPDGYPVKGGTNKLGPGVDVKARGGYILLPGSTIAGKAYQWINERPIARAMPWLVDRCNAAKPKTDAAGQRIVEEDDQARQLAEQWLEQRAPTAQHGEIDDTTYKIAARLYDFGCSFETVHELVSEWNETHCFPPGDTERLEVVCESAGRNRDNAIGAKHPQAPGFEAVEIDETAKPADLGTTTPEPLQLADTLATPLTPFIAQDLPKRPWVLHGFACRGRVTLLAGPGGVAKSTYYLMVAIAIVTGRGDICGFQPVKRERAWVWNQEDDLEEMQRRVAAIMQAFNVSWDDLKDENGELMLFIDSGVDRPLMLAKRKDQFAIAPGPQVASIIATIRARKIAALFLDPLVEFHEASENDNVQMRAVVGQVRRIAVEADCATLLATHTRKPPAASSDGFAGEMDAARGASAQLGVVRIGATIFSMSPKQAKEMNIPVENHLDYVRVDIAKNNLAPVLAAPIWFKREGAQVGGEGGESVGILRPVQLAKRTPAATPVRERTATQSLDRTEVLAEIIATKLSREKWIKLTDVLRMATPTQLAMFGGEKNRAAVVKAAFDGNEKCATNSGMLAIVSRGGTSPTNLRLGPPPKDLPDLPNLPAEDLPDLPDDE